MKTILLSLLCLVLFIQLNAQSGFTCYGLSNGISSNNSKLISFTIEGSGNKKIHAGVMVESLFYASDISKYSIAGSKAYLSAGLFLKTNITNTRNFNQQLFLGGNIGTDNKNTIWYPQVGLEQNFFCSSHIQLFTTQKCLYIFGITGNNWQPILSIGIRYSN
jgi:hypothetical protein